VLKNQYRPVVWRGVFKQLCFVYCCFAHWNFYLASEKERYNEKAKRLALLGFMPALVFLVFLLV
jgi:hypothetical protein